MNTSEKQEHHVTYIDEVKDYYLPSGYERAQGTTAYCTCGWKKWWWVRDGSAEQDGHYHKRAYDPVYDAECEARDKAQRKELEEIKISLSYCPERPPLPSVEKIKPHDHGCSCHISAPCGPCERCAHWGIDDCPNDCQDCEDHYE